MFPNTSLPPHTLKSSKDDQATTVDIDAIMDNVSIVLYTLTVLLGITGNSMVIWVAGFKLKVNLMGYKYFLRKKKSLPEAHCPALVLFIFIT